MIILKVDNIEFFVKPKISILEACKHLGLMIPRFCYHETLSVAGNCRMCLVEVEGLEKPVASCVTEVDANMSVFLNSPFVKKARENVVETLLINHPLDCPICDQAGECDLQDQTKVFGGDYSRFFFNKRGVEDKNCGPLIKTIMTRCIHCTRCVRFSSEVAGVDFLGTFNRGTSTEIGNYVSQMFKSEISGNVIDLCPVGALTSKPYAFKARPWELKLNESIDLTDGLGSNIYVNFKESEIFRVVPKSVSTINNSFISDKARFSYDSLTHNRIENLFFKDANKSKFLSINWVKFFKQINTYLSTKKNIQIIINNELDLVTMHFLKKLENKFLGRVKLNTVDSVSSQTNFLVTNSVDSVLDIDRSNGVCFLLSSNPKIESAILNTRLRLKYQNNLYNIYSLGQTFSYNIPSTFINLSLNNILKIFEGKNATLTKLLVKSQNPLIIIGEHFNNRFFGIDNFIQFIRSNISSAKIIKVRTICNSVSQNFLNIQNINTKVLDQNDVVFAINLDDTVSFRKSLRTKNKAMVWLNSHGSDMALESDFILPTLTSFENEEIFLNLEERPQKTNRTFSTFFNAQSVKDIFKAIFNFNDKYIVEKNNYLKFLLEIIQTPQKFELKNKILTPKIFNKELIVVQTYPIKSRMEDFYLSNKFTKNSLVMSQCSQGIRKSTTNFYEILSN
jgi:NADH-quinone oxidoreductase subunit G